MRSASVALTLSTPVARLATPPPLRPRAAALERQPSEGLAERKTASTRQPWARKSPSRGWTACPEPPKHQHSYPRLEPVAAGETEMELTAGACAGIPRRPAAAAAAAAGRGVQAEKAEEGGLFPRRLETRRGVGVAGVMGTGTVAAAAARARRGRPPPWQEAHGQQAQARACPKGMEVGPAETMGRGAKAEAVRGAVVEPAVGAAVGAGGIDVPLRERAEGGSETMVTATASTEIGWSAAEERTVSAGVMPSAIETTEG